MNKLPQKRPGPVAALTPVLPGKAYLQVGDRVFHKRFKLWGYGIVTEARTSLVPGGFSYARIRFKDGKQRVFDNNFSSASCCYYAGITLLERIEL